MFMKCITRNTLLIFLVMMLLSGTAFSEEKDALDSSVIYLYEEGNGNSIMINAVVTIPEEDALVIDLVRDEEQVLSLINELLGTSTNIRQINTWKWLAYNTSEKDVPFSASLACSDDWVVSFLNVLLDSDGATLEDQHLFDDYITSLQPKYCELSVEAAIKQMEQALNKWSDCLTFQVNRVLAVDGKPVGFFDLHADAYYQGIKINNQINQGLMIPLESKNHGGFGQGFSLCHSMPQAEMTISDQGIFSFHGVFLLKENNTKSIQINPADEIARTLIQQFWVLTQFKNVIISDIDMQYVCLSDSECHNFQLRPVWCYSGSGIHPETGNETSITFLYYADDGTFCTIQ